MVYHKKAFNFSYILFDFMKFKIKFPFFNIIICFVFFFQIRMTLPMWVNLRELHEELIYLKVNSSKITVCPCGFLRYYMAFACTICDIFTSNIYTHFLSSFFPAQHHDADFVLKSLKNSKAFLFCALPTQVSMNIP
jgi:hypothetical protein